MMNSDMAGLADLLSHVNPGAARALVLPPMIGLMPLVVWRFKRSPNDGSYACHVAAVMAVIFGVVGLIAGLAHSAAVASLAMKEPEYGPLQMLRLTTGELILYSGAMSVAVSRAIWAGRRWAIAIAISTTLLFLLHLAFVLPLPGTGGTVPGALGVWSVYILWLGAAAFASWRRDHRVRPIVRPAAA